MGIAHSAVVCCLPTGLSTLFDAEVPQSSEPWCTPPVTGAFRMNQRGPEARLRGNPPQSPL
eukprot:5503868-Karenia_brevis.AAC.1